MPLVFSELFSALAMQQKELSYPIKKLPPPRLEAVVGAVQSDSN